MTKVNLEILPGEVEGYSKDFMKEHGIDNYKIFKNILSLTFKDQEHLDRYIYTFDLQDFVK